MTNDNKFKSMKFNYKTDWSLKLQPYLIKYILLQNLKI